MIAKSLLIGSPKYMVNICRSYSIVNIHVLIYQSIGFYIICVVCCSVCIHVACAEWQWVYANGVGTLQTSLQGNATDQCCIHHTNVGGESVLGTWHRVHDWLLLWAMWDAPRRKTKKQLQYLVSNHCAIVCQPGPSDAAVDLAWSYSRGVTLAAEKQGHCYSECQQEMPAY
jgi:hypothetical protein